MVQKLNCCWDRYCQIYSTKGRNLFTLNSISSFSLCLSRIMPRLRSRLWWAERSSPSSSCLRTAAAQSGRTRQKKKRKKLPEFVWEFVFLLPTFLRLRSPKPPPAMLDWKPVPRNGIGGVWRDVAGQHVCPGLLGQRDPEAHHQPARRGRGVLRDKDRVVWQEHFILAPELLRSGPLV